MRSRRGDSRTQRYENVEGMAASDCHPLRCAAARADALRAKKASDVQKRERCQTSRGGPKWVVPGLTTEKANLSKAASSWGDTSFF